jgi:pilus assembly protein Flp/PilA
MLGEKVMQIQKVTGKRKQFGQGMVEYIIIVALIAIAAIGVYSMFGKTVRNQSAGLAKELAGKDAAGALGNADTSSGTAETRGNADKGMSQYNVDNDQN